MPPAPPAPPLALTDDQLAERLADALVALAARPGPHRVAAGQITGLLPPPGLISDEELALNSGCTEAAIYKSQRRAMAKLRANDLLRALAGQS